MVSKAPKIQCFLSTCRSLFLCQFLDTASGSFIGPGISSQWYVNIMRGKDKSIAYFIEHFQWETWPHIGQSWNRKDPASHKHHGVPLVTLWCARPPPPTSELRYTQSHCQSTGNYSCFPGLLWHSVPQTTELHCLRAPEFGSPKSRCVWIGSFWGLWRKIWSWPLPRFANGNLAGCSHGLPSTPVCVKMSPFL